MAVDHLRGQTVAERASAVVGTKASPIRPVARVLALPAAVAVQPEWSKQQPQPVGSSQPTSSPAAGSPV